MAEMTEFEKKRAAAQKAAEEQATKPKRKKKKELTPEQIQAQIEEEKQMIKDFYHKKYEDIKIRSEQARQAELAPPEDEKKKEEEAKAEAEKEEEARKAKEKGAYVHLIGHNNHLLP
eukprot:TRINITY_DN47959_c0_g1_i1.p2 TRINITY_DN47959_c0_g1~~TRINITY_DN47959_c0_g1_i1.p2  ORF type:complete len:117 (+),score=42.75 TRINITY_DN47959_c0_g1_i1:65-415(+)